MVNWGRRGQRSRDEDVSEAEFAGSQAGPLALLGGIIGGIFGWLMSSGALPHPSSLPIPAAEPLRTAVALGVLGALVAGLLGALTDQAAKDDPEEAETITPAQTDQR